LSGFSFNKYLLSTFSVPDTVLGTEDTKANKIGKLSLLGPGRKGWKISQLIIQ
jgi:hypothetical protein